MRTIFLSIAFLSSLTLYSQESPGGFRGWDWGTPINTLSEQIARSDRKVSGYKSFYRKGDCKTFEGIAAGEILYLFKKEKLAGVLIYIHPIDFDRMKEILTQEYGPSKQITSDKVKKNIWMGEGTLVELLKISISDRVEQISIRIMPPKDSG